MTTPNSRRNRARRFVGARVPRLSANQRVPLFQRVIAGGALVLGAPLLAAAASAVRLTSPGPALFTQQRLGRGGQPITIVKLRTMRTDSASTSTATTASDSRITPVGGWLRRYKLDEIPQLWSVVKGDMAIIGPRPDVAEVIAGLSPPARQRLLDQRPGITGIASVYFRDEASLLDTVDDPDRFSAGPLIEAKTILNEAYLSGATWRDDLRVVALTLRPRPNAVAELAARLAPGYSDSAPFQAIATPTQPPRAAPAQNESSGSTKRNSLTTMTGPQRILLSPPDLRGGELEALAQALESGWVTTAGPALDRFEAEIAARAQRRYAVGVTSGTAALELSLIAAGIEPGATVGCSTLTFVASANAIMHAGATPVFFDSDTISWNIDPNLVEDELKRRARTGDQLDALVAVDLYGQCADYGAIEPLCDHYGVTLIEDAAEALGATCATRPAGSFGQSAAFSFNGNKIITTSGGGMVVTDDASIAQRIRYLATQARQPVRHYEHTEVGFNFRLSNLLAALGSCQLDTLDERVTARRAIHARYEAQLGDLPGWHFMPEANYGTCIFWLTCATVDAESAGFGAHELVERLEAANIESRPVWKPMHLQPLFADAPVVGGTVAQSLFTNGLCLPSGSSLTDDQVDRVAAAIHAVYGT